MSDDLQPLKDLLAMANGTYLPPQGLANAALPPRRESASEADSIGLMCLVDRHAECLWEDCACQDPIPRASFLPCGSWTRARLRSALGSTMPPPPRWWERFFPRRWHVVA